jgi:Domain of unknown function (DUF3883)
MGLGDIRREDVLGAIALMDDPVRNLRVVVDELHFGPAKNYRLVYKGKFYDSKAVVGVAHGIPTDREYLSRWDFTGGVASVVRVLVRLGFYVDDGFLYDITQLRVDQTHGRPAAYQFVVLLWAFARARSGLPRMVPFNDVRNELAEILARFAVARTAPDPVMPWIALAGSLLWELEKPSEAKSVSESDVKSLNLAGGLSVSVYNRIAQDNLYRGFVGAAIDVIAVRVAGERGFEPLLEQFGFADLGSITSVGGSPAVEDAIAAVESVGNPRRKIGRHFTAEENAEIEQRAVLVTRQHFEDELGYETEDVGAYESYDVLASKGQELVKVEVKGTTTDGAEVVLTRNEVSLHRVEYPNNALAVVRNITLDRSGDQPIATSGELVLVMPWEIDEGGLIPIAYDYRTGI